MKLRQNDSILFIGDSVTDAGRKRDDEKDLGHGYPLLIAATLLAQYPEMGLTFLNRGVGGNKIKDLAERWKRDCLSLAPSVVSILIGINDTWHNVSAGAIGSGEELGNFEIYYRMLLQSLRDKTNAQIVLLEPFVLPYPEDREMWRTDLDPRIQLIRRLAKEYQAEYVALDGRLNEVGISNGFDYLTGTDGVHPTAAGHGVIAKAWLEKVHMSR